MVSSAFKSATRYSINNNKEFLSRYRKMSIEMGLEYQKFYVRLKRCRHNYWAAVQVGCKDTVQVHVQLHSATIKAVTKVNLILWCTHFPKYKVLNKIWKLIPAAKIPLCLIPFKFLFFLFPKAQKNVTIKTKCGL